MQSLNNKANTYRAHEPASGGQQGHDHTSQAEDKAGNHNKQKCAKVGVVDAVGTDLVGEVLYKDALNDGRQKK